MKSAAMIGEMRFSRNVDCGDSRGDSGGLGELGKFVSAPAAFC
jgi:hypothetical protein